MLLECANSSSSSWFLDTERNRPRASSRSRPLECSESSTRGSIFGDGNMESSFIPMAGNGTLATRVGNGRRDAEVDGRGDARIVGLLIALKHSLAQGSPKPKHGSFSSQAIL